MAEWRLGRGWTSTELAGRLADAARRGRNFSPDATLTREHGWSRHASHAVIAREAPGPPEPGGAFERACRLVDQYAFSDPRIVCGHFDRAAPVLHRRMLLEIRVLGLRFLGAVVVGAVRSERNEHRTVCGHRYDTLEGHVERGCEWFTLTKDHATGDVTFAIRAAWQRGELPHWWQRLGFNLVARRYQRAWHRLAHLRLRAMLGSVGLEPLPRADRLVQESWPGSIAPAQLAAPGGPHAGIADEREGAHRTQEEEEMTQLTAAFGLGVVSGARSMLAPALVSQAFAASSSLLTRDGFAGRLLSSPRAAQLLPLLAAGELAADKLPWTPPRTDLPSLVGRIGSGALVGAAIASPENRVACALGGGAGALTGTGAGYYLRRIASGRGMPDWVAAVCEDALAVGLGLTLLRKMRLKPPLRSF